MAVYSYMPPQKPRLDGQYTAGLPTWQNMVPKPPKLATQLGQRITQTQPAPSPGPLPNQPFGPMPKSSTPPPVTPNPNPYIPVQQPTDNDIWGYQDPITAANLRAQRLVDTGTAAYNDQIAQIKQGYEQARNKLKDDLEYGERIGAQANFRTLQQRNAVNSGLRDRLANQLEYTQMRSFNRANEDLNAKELADQNTINTQIANLKASLPNLQAQEYDKALATDASEIDNALKQAAATGIYMPGKVQSYLAGVMKAKQDWLDAQARGDKAGMDKAHTLANQLRMAMQRYGIDPTSVEANITLPDATVNMNSIGVMTPEMRDRLASYYGYDPVSGKMTLAGRQTNQAIDMGDLDLAVAGNPDYGKVAQARADLAKILADIENTKAQTGKIKQDTKNGIDNSITRAEVMKNWGVDDLGLTTNFGAFDLAMSQAAEQINNNVPLDKIQQWLYQEGDRIKANGVDPGAVWRAVKNFAARIGYDAKQDYLNAEHGRL